MAVQTDSSRKRPWEDTETQQQRQTQSRVMDGACDSLNEKHPPVYTHPEVAGFESPQLRQHCSFTENRFENPKRSVAEKAYPCAFEQERRESEGSLNHSTAEAFSSMGGSWSSNGTESVWRSSLSRTESFPESMASGHHRPPEMHELERTLGSTRKGADRCSPTCNYPSCPGMRMYLRELTSELVALSSLLASMSLADPEQFNESPPVSDFGACRVLTWAIEKIRSNTSSLRKQGLERGGRSSDRAFAHHNTLPSRPSAHGDQSFHLAGGDSQVSAANGPHSSVPNRPILPPPSCLTGERHMDRALGITDPQYQLSQLSGSSSHTMSPPSAFSGSIGLLSSPTSNDFATTAAPRQFSLPLGETNMLLSATMEDLQHQINVKSQALQTLQKEYDGLLQRLEHDRAEYAIFDRRSEATDAEINSLSDEKERLQSQLLNLEPQVEEFRQSRDDARHQLASSNSQYMRIVEMATKLQSQNTDEKRLWGQEKEQLEERLKTLEEAMVVGLGDPQRQYEGESSPALLSLETADVSHPEGLVQTSIVSETVAVLRSEIARLRNRNRSLECAIISMKDENDSVREAANQILESSTRMRGEIGMVSDYTP